MPKLDNIVKRIENTTGHRLVNHRFTSIGGGCINSAYKLHTSEHSYFIKLNQPQLLSMFEAEAAGLEEMAALNCVRVPQVICHGQADGHSYLALEYIELSSLRGQANQLLGKQLAQLHQHTQPFFGWHIDNTIGSTPQNNNREQDWLIFWQQNRLEQQLKFTTQNGFGGRLQDKGQRLSNNLHHFFEGYSPSPSLLHGDLWGGNAAADPQGNPVIFDPACYYGDRETDIAMTELFGGFGSDFFAAYQAEYPLDPGYKVRKTLYNLYHILNHVNLFGSGYLGQAESMIEQLLAEI
ncbi:MAG: fructosamine kinase family protein [Gammaproteobacteria bacterium]|nr:MAG: fructosamine kinase family protein [Gammaproteobacteria bacterium]RKZ94669.1 MAG: fructosamine kinase family protein [Gammaproteobacteria bacterium]